MHSVQGARICSVSVVTRDVNLRASRRLASIFVGLLLSSFLIGAIYLFDGVSHSATPSPINGPAVAARDPLTWPFSRDSIWNLPIGANANYVWGSIVPSTAAGGLQVDSDVLVLTPNAPVTPWYYNADAWNGGTRCAAQGGALFNAPIPASFVIPGAYQGSPDGTTPNYATAILDANGHTLYQGQPSARCTPGGTATMWWYQKNEDLYSTGISGAHGGSMLSSVGGTIRLGELVPGGTIRHAVKVNFDSPNIYPGPPRWPALARDGCAPGCYQSSNPALRMGALLALQPNYNFAQLETESGRIVAHAFQDYGGYLVDHAGWSVYGLSVEFSPSGRVPDEFRSRFGYDINPPSKATPWARDLDRIFTNLAVINNWDSTVWASVSASNGLLGAGLGAARVSWAPDFGVIPPPPPTVVTTSTLTSSKNPSAINETITVSGRLVDATAKPVAGRTVTLEWSGDGITWSREAQIGQFPLTDANGAFTGTMAFHGLTAHTEYLRANFAGDSAYAASLSSVWAQSIVAPPSIDTIPPFTTYTMSGVAGNSNWYTSPVTVSLTSSDVGSGVASVNVRVDGGAYTTYATPVIVSGEGSHTVDYYTVDVVGNRETTRTISFRIDSIAPMDSAAISGTLGANGWYVSPVTGTVAGSDSGSGFSSIQMRTNGAPWFTYAGPITISTNGAHLVEYFPVDIAGNRGITKNVSFRIDMVGPVTTAAMAGTAGSPGWYTSDVSISMSAKSSNGTSTAIAYRVDGGLWSSYTAPFTLSEGRHVLAYQATDSSGAIEPLHSMPINVDTTAPILGVAAGILTIPTGGYISWTGSDVGSGIASYAVSVDGGAFQSVGTKTSVNGAWAEGQHTAVVKAQDAAGNEATKTMTFVVDKNAPAQVGPIPTISEALLGLPVLLILASLVLGLAGVGLGVRRARRARDSGDDLDAQVDEYLDEIEADVESI